ncbi:gamma-glutamylaminecyclotransferase isoform X1 [Chionomys nivalis]|uniref:gamma-glutamylaminecyclotransferase isoform X1 n=1 Tax=Chionomys nivalis TaxID=269649 RepID=UPI0025963109|nr:gamma-glutamylaminecyclotransferase isoform X1 [Chionomys nivalis]XP_057641895.1 gamma-glutamylaminecyclotransferase isoform X1 [Chionomys nivalis]XP_057641896.1 gamma-glutamylaminecyclotransferase isoform X1 [Chionomys nivalis]
MAHVFVYGTLKRGQPNHKVMLDQSHGSAAFQGRGCTLESFPLVIAGEHNIPWLLHLPGKGHCVAGEIYKVDEQMLSFLDDFEGCPSMYQRTALQVQVLEWEGADDPGDRLQCFVYSTTTYAPEWLHLPYHKSYDSEGPHGLRYNPRESSYRTPGTLLLCSKDGISPVTKDPAAVESQKLNVLIPTYEI